MINAKKAHSAPMSTEIGRWENEGGATARSEKVDADSIKAGRPTIIAALLLAAIAALVVHFAFS
jgi:hypothetical protein